ncbi:MAG TPA: glycosyltransferase family 2 protein [Gammaproteobacteria bacterium]|nr:glycosyltransferase family 2 protein [Gammaproteobacteria bacterium]
MVQKPSINVVVLNYNSADHTLSCVEYIYRQNTDLFHLDLIVVDNNSASSDRDKLAVLTASNTKLIYSDINLGFSGGMMLGAKDSKADYYFLLNNDCELQVGSLAALCDFMESHPSAALCSGSMLDNNGNPRTSFNYFPSLTLTILGSSLLRMLYPMRYPDRRRLYARPVPVDVVTGAAMFIRGTVFRELNGLDTGYFLYCEEEDFAMRVRKAGWKTYHVPQAKIMHIGGASSKDPAVRPALKQEYYISLFRYLRIHCSYISVLIFRLVYALRLLRRAITGKARYELALFVLSGAPEKESLRYKQTERN